MSLTYTKTLFVPVLVIERNLKNKEDIDVEDIVKAIFKQLEKSLMRPS